MEFGSDFHTFDYPQGGNSILSYFPESNLYASGRQALLDLTIARGWKRLWIPSYFCEETLECIPQAGIELCKYNITPNQEPYDIVEKIPVEKSDCLLVVNYFGLFGKRKFLNIGCEIIEDHTHNLIGDWALNSCSDWCLASLRKTLPIADGGILWSSKHHHLPAKPPKIDITEEVMSERVDAMNLKQRYLSGGDIEKGDFLKLFGSTEEEFDRLPISHISDLSFQIVSNLDINAWYDAKHRNWKFLYENLRDTQAVKILIPEVKSDCPFSLTLLFKDNETRNRVRKRLIDKSVYPAILWPIEDKADKDARLFGNTMLSIHCDGRYSLQDMELLLSIIKHSLT